VFPFLRRIWSERKQIPQLMLSISKRTLHHQLDQEQGSKEQDKSESNANETIALTTEKDVDNGVAKSYKIQQGSYWKFFGIYVAALVLALLPILVFGIINGERSEKSLAFISLLDHLKELHFNLDFLAFLLLKGTFDCPSLTFARCIRYFALESLNFYNLAESVFFVS
jgi:hypothetical protein